MKSYLSEIRNKASFIFFITFSSILIAVILYAYKTTALSQKLEDVLFDIRTIAKPQLVPQDPLVVVTISDQDIKNLQGSDSKNLTPKSMKKILEEVIANEPKNIGVLLPHQDFKYETPEMKSLYALSHRFKNIFFGIFDHASLRPDTSTEALLAQNGAGVFAAADSHRKYRREVVRKTALFSYFGKNLRPHFTLQFAERIHGMEDGSKLHRLIKNQSKVPKEGYYRNEQSLPRIVLNYRSPHTFINIDATEVSKRKEEIQNKHVLVGYTSFRKRKSIYRDGTYANSPWQNESNDVSQSSGMPLIYVYSTAIENLVEEAWLDVVPKWIEILQVLIISGIAFWLWRAPVTVAMAMYLGIILILTYIHAVSMSLFNSLMPMADTVVFSFFATIAGAFWRAQKDSHARAAKEVKSLDDVTLLQQGFLLRFSHKLYGLNSQVEEILCHCDMPPPDKESEGQALIKARESSQELKEYLKSIEPLISIEDNVKYKKKSDKVDLGFTMKRLNKQFEARLQEKKIKVIYQNVNEVYLWSDWWIVESILFNFLSNAIKYSPEGSEVIVESSRVSSGKLQISVSDDGPGISKEFHQKIFDKFYRIKNDSVYEIKGSGLGLYLSQFFAKKIGTSIQIDSKLGEGATFSIEVKRFKPVHTLLQFIRLGGNK